MTNQDQAFVIGVDASTSAVKAVAFAADGEQIGLGHTPLTLIEERAGWAEQHATEWYSALVSSLRKLGAQVDLSRAVGLAITCQRETVAILDADGNEIRPAITWVDTRCGSQVERFGARVHEITGRPAAVSDSLFKLIWLRENEPDTLDAAVTIVDTAGYLIESLTGKRVTSFATASTLTVVDIHSRCYSDELLELCGLTAEQFPEMVDTMQQLGTVTAQAAAATGLPVGLPVIATVGDGQAAGVGVGVVDGNTGYASLGTGIALGAASSKYVHSPAFPTLEGYSPGHYYLEPVLATGSYLISWFVRTFGVEADPESARSPEQVIGDQARNVPPGANGLYCLPYWGGVLSPYWDRTPSGVFIGLRGVHALPHMYRAVLEGLSYEIRICLEAVEGARGGRLEELVVVGGGSRSELWVQTIADVCNRTVYVCAQTEVASLGAAVHAASATGLRPGESIAQVARGMASRGAAFAPDPERAAFYEHAFQGYRQIYELNRPIFAALHATE